MNDHKYSAISKILLVVSGLLFILLFFILSYYNRFAADDYDNIQFMSKYGIVGGMLFAYMSFCGRWTAYLLWGIIYHFSDIRAALVCYSFSVIVVFITAQFFLLKMLLFRFNLESRKREILGYAVFLSAYYFFSSFGKGEVWFWVASTAIYINSISAFLLIIVIILKSRNSFINYLILVLLSVYTGGAAESYSVFYLLIILLFLCIPSRFIVQWPFFKGVSKKAAAVAFVFLLTAFLVSFFSPGVKIRTGWLPERSVINAFYFTFKALGSTMIFKVFYQIPYLLLFSFPIIAIGRNLNKNKPVDPIVKFVKPFFISGCCLIGIIYIAMYPACYLLSESGPDRALSHVILMIVMFFAFWSFYIGYNYYIEERLLRKIQFASLISIIILMVYSIITQVTIVTRYSDALDKRIEYFKNLDATIKNKIVHVKSLPPSGFLFSAEFKQDTTNYRDESFEIKVVLDK